MPSSLEDILQLESLDTNLFRSHHHRENFRNILFGGQVLGQALAAVQNTVDDVLPHSLHAYFLRPGRSNAPVIYDVENVRDGRSFCSRRVVARQHGHSIFHMTASFHAKETGHEHQLSAPEGIPSPEEILARNNVPVPDPHISSENTQGESHGVPFHLLPVNDNVFSSKDVHEPHTSFWIKTTEKLPNNPALHFSALTFASDLGLIATALLPHETTLFDSSISAASIDHAMWFHNYDFRADEWMLYQTNSPWAGQARGFAQGRIFTREGKLIASTAQEGLIRPLPTN